MKRTILFGFMAVILANAAWAVSFSGSLSSLDGGMTGRGVWGSNSQGQATTLSWTVDNDSPSGLWHYNYTFDVPLINHRLDEIQFVQLETANNVRASDFQNLTFGPETPATLNEVGTLRKRGIQPADMFGAQIIHTERREDIEGGPEGHVLTINFDTTHAPTWGDFYGNGFDSNEIINAGFTKNDVDPTAAPDNGTMANNLLVPGPITAVGTPTPSPSPSPIPSPSPGPGAIPEPLTMLALSLLAVPLGAQLRRRLGK